ncbi:MAG: peptide chain release factor 3 [Deltaproteobacteria bacterium GWC2_65_14]|nr:MAG: peptide chain release factor 3 [Deltaproteobacteria bacterium GWC2_65_14]
MSDNHRIQSEISRRRTFAIISHPDAGKTTLTEKLLLYGGAIHLAGAVKERRGGRQTTSDWMELERQRGISITTSVLQFEYEGCRMNLLDTPGHNDFSEDTYRTLAAADSAVMLIDSVKGVEPQTIKLFEVCRLRRTPVVTFINKMDRHGREPLELLDEIERVLGIPTSPVNWPIGSGSEFQGVYDRWSRNVLRFVRAEGGSRRAPMHVDDLHAPGFREMVGDSTHHHLLDELTLLDGAGSGFNIERFMRGEVTPVFFGSAINNFGVEPFLERFRTIAPAPGDFSSSDGRVAAKMPRFSGFVFKIQANMDPLHRDRVAFARVCSGRFRRGMEVNHVRTGKVLTLNRTLQFLGQERVFIDEAFAGDVIGIWDPGVLRIGDTLSEQGEWEFEGIPRFSPEHFVRVRLADPMKRKQLKKGLEQLSEEGAVQLFFDRTRLERDPVLGAVGVLQFDVTQHRLKSEYGVSVSLEHLPFRIARWVEPKPGEQGGNASIPSERGCKNLVDIEGRDIMLFDSEWKLGIVEERYPGLRFVAAMQPGRSGRSTNIG